MGPLVSIIIASYNKAKFIKATMTSVIEQTYTNWELIIVDDHSTDDSVNIINEHLTDKRIELFKGSENKGANVCRNIGIKAAKGNYIIFLDADDLLVKKCLELRINAALAQPQKNLLVFSMGVFKTNIGDTMGVWHPTSNDPLKDFFQHKLPWSILQPLWKKEVLIELNGFDESFLRLQDVELNTKALLLKNINYKLIPGNPDCYYRIDEARKNFNTYDFLERWVVSAIQYYNKFYREAKLHNKQTYLLGTIYETYLQIIYNTKQKKLATDKFQKLEKELLDKNKVAGLIFFKRKLIHISKIYNLYCFRVPGVNRLIKKCMVAG